ncbi:hypothetical protein ACIBHX_49910 [Nonomuraea sp. NPDC050536]
MSETAPTVGQNLFVWGLETPGVTLRYTLTFTASTWHEVGEFTFDGG